MSFKRSGDTAKERQLWKVFVRAHFNELCEIGMPEHIFSNKSHFDHWLMHGRHPLDPSGFAVEDLDQTQRNRLVHLLGAYVDAGFGDPGVAIITEDERRRIWGTHGHRRPK